MKISASKNRMYQDVEFLTSLRPFRNYRNILSLEKVVDYLKKELNDAGYKTTEQVWEAEGNQYKNVIASSNQTASQRLIVGAHYDVYGNMPGADDNASAVAGLLETARLITQNKPDIDYGIDFVAYCLEEPPFFFTEKMGSYVHAKSVRESETDVIGMICYEMIGYFSEEPGSQEYPNEQMKLMYPDKGNFIVVVGIEKYQEFNQKVYHSMKQLDEVDTQIAQFPNMNSYASMSDHSSYWKCGYPALMINDSSFLRNPHYHRPTDTIDTLDFKKMAGVVNGAYHAIINF